MEDVGDFFAADFSEFGCGEGEDVFTFIVDAALDGAGGFGGKEFC